LIDIAFGEVKESCKVGKPGSFCLWFPAFRDMVEEG